MGWFFPHKTINSIVGVKIMQELHLLFSSPLIILMVAKKKKKLYSVKHWHLKRKSNAWSFHSFRFREAWLTVTAQYCTWLHRHYDGREATEGSLLVNFTTLCSVYISLYAFFIVAVTNSLIKIKWLDKHIPRISVEGLFGISSHFSEKHSPVTDYYDY